MPDRVLRAGINSSDLVNELNVHAEVFYRRLMSVVDDYSRFDARPAIVRAACFPLRIDVVREADVSRWLTEVESAGLIALYAVDRKPFLVMFKADKPRAKNSKFPEPPEGIECWRVGEPAPVLTSARTCAQMRPYSNAHSSSISSLSYSGSVPPAAGERVGKSSKNGKSPVDDAHRRLKS